MAASSCGFSVIFTLEYHITFTCMNPISSFWRGRQHLSPLSPSTVLSTLTPKVGDMATPLPSSKEGAAVVTSNDQGHLLPTLCTHLTLVSQSLQALPHLILWSPYHCGPALIPDPGTMAAPRHWSHCHGETRHAFDPGATRCACNLEPSCLAAPRACRLQAFVLWPLLRCPCIRPWDHCHCKCACKLDPGFRENASTMTASMGLKRIHQEDYSSLCHWTPNHTCHGGISHQSWPPEATAIFTDAELSCCTLLGREVLHPTQLAPHAHL